MPVDGTLCVYRPGNPACPHIKVGQYMYPPIARPPTDRMRYGPDPNQRIWLWRGGTTHGGTARRCRILRPERRERGRPLDTYQPINGGATEACKDRALSAPWCEKHSSSGSWPCVTPSTGKHTTHNSAVADD